MIPTLPLSVQAERACKLANGAAARGRKSSDKRKLAQRLTGLALIQEIRKSGGHVERKHEQALRG